MTRRSIGAAVALVCVTMTAIITGPIPAQGATSSATVTVTTHTEQTIEGFGASGAWWPDDLINFSPDVQQQVDNDLFTSQGIDLSGYRYNIGGGGVGVTNPVRGPALPADDTAGISVLKAASSDGVPELTGFVNSAPTQFTSNHNSCGGTLIAKDIKKYATWLAAQILMIQTTDGVTLGYVSPMNEPDNSFAACNQEGMEVPVSMRAKLVVALATALQNDDLPTKVIADETTWDAILAYEGPLWLGDPGVRSSIAAIAHHTYDYPAPAVLKEVKQLGKRYDLPTWMTEICCYDGDPFPFGFGASYDPTMNQGLWLANQISNDFTIAGDSAFYWWTALSSSMGCDPKTDMTCATKVNKSGWNDGLLYYDANYATDGNQAITTTKRYSVLGQFSRYVRPGAQLVEVRSPHGSTVTTMAFQDGDDWTVVTWNNATSARSFTLNLPSSTQLEATGAVETSPTQDLAASAPPTSTDNSWGIELAPKTIETLTFAPQH